MLDDTVERHENPAALMEAEQAYWSNFLKTLVAGKYGAHKQLPVSTKAELLNKMDSRLKRWARLYKTEPAVIQGYGILRPIWLNVLSRANMKTSLVLPPCIREFHDTEEDPSITALLQEEASLTGQDKDNEANQDRANTTHERPTAGSSTADDGTEAAHENNVTGKTRNATIPIPPTELGRMTQQQRGGIQTETLHTETLSANTVVENSYTPATSTNTTTIPLANETIIPHTRLSESANANTMMGDILARAIAALAATNNSAQLNNGPLPPPRTRRGTANVSNLRRTGEEGVAQEPTGGQALLRQLIDTYHIEDDLLGQYQSASARSNAAPLQLSPGSDDWRHYSTPVQETENPLRFHRQGRVQPEAPQWALSQQLIQQQQNEMQRMQQMYQQQAEQQAALMQQISHLQTAMQRVLSGPTERDELQRAPLTRRPSTMAIVTEQQNGLAWNQYGPQGANDNSTEAPRASVMQRTMRMAEGHNGLAMNWNQGTLNGPPLNPHRGSETEQGRNGPMNRDHAALYRTDERSSRSHNQRGHLQEELDDLPPPPSELLRFQEKDARHAVTHFAGTDHEGMEEELALFERQALAYEARLPTDQKTEFVEYLKLQKLGPKAYMAIRHKQASTVAELVTGLKKRYAEPLPMQTAIDRLSACAQNGRAVLDFVKELSQIVDKCRSGTTADTYVESQALNRLMRGCDAFYRDKLTARMPRDWNTAVAYIRDLSCFEETPARPLQIDGRPSVMFTRARGQDNVGRQREWSRDRTSEPYGNPRGRSRERNPNLRFSGRDRSYNRGEQRDGSRERGYMPRDRWPSRSRERTRYPETGSRASSRDRSNDRDPNRSSRERRPSGDSRSRDNSGNDFRPPSRTRNGIIERLSENVEGLVQRFDSWEKQKNAQAPSALKKVEG